MKKLLLVLFTLPGIIWSQQKLIKIEGNVSDGEKPLTRVSVQISRTNGGTETDSSGSYSIKATPGDVLVFKHMGMENEEVIVEDVTSVLNIKMRPKIEQLDEVVVQKRKWKSQKELAKEFDTNKRLVRTNYGILDQDRVGYTLRVIDEEDINLGFVNLLDVIQAKFPGIYLRPELNDYLKIAYLNRTKTLNGAVPLLYEVDGVVTPDPPFIPVTEVKRLALISGVGGTIRYGTRGAGGVVIINTKHGTFRKRPNVASKLGIKTFEDSKAVEYQYEIPTNYLKELRSTKTLQEAIASFNKTYVNSPYDYLEAYSHFSEQWNHQETMNRIVDTVLSKFGDNAVVLKALAYKLEEAGDFIKALAVYQKIFELRPNYEQSYRDVAHAYHQIGDHKTAMRYYTNKNGFSRFENKDVGDKEGIDFTMLTELNALVTQNMGELSLKPSTKRFGQVPKGTRMLLEWNTGEAEFDVHLINPTKQYFTWSHTSEKNKERIRDEKLRGYSSEQFFMDGNSKGKWQINLGYFGNKSQDPTYLKVTLWTNYGTSFEKKMVKLFRFTEENENYKLFTFMNSPLDYEQVGK
ncbi:carboxypeptidase-like regulatory domain-containing protein [Flagellimonas sp.]|uniref:carboxypeptidase-like regulatory domain-containing protein n=1 Tax=Flagellimonas sp. TaxID=2058762 RepID=UPI003B50F8E1